MAHCKYCGGWAGLVNNEHADCKARALAPRPPSLFQPANSGVDVAALVAQLKPLIYGAGWRAGMSAALTFIGLGLLAGFLYFVINFSSLPTSR